MSDPFYYPESYEDWRVDIYRIEHECAVRVTHIPTGIVETCSDTSKTMLSNRREAFRRAEERIVEWHYQQEAL